MGAAMIGTASTYPQLRALIAARRKSLGLSQLEVDDIAGVQSGYTGKIECGARHLGDMSMGAILGALGLELGVMPTAGKHKNSIDSSEASVRLLSDARKKLASSGGKARALKLNPIERRAIARGAARKRWSDWRLIQAAKAKKAKRKG